MIKFDYDGQNYTYDDDTVTLSEIRYVKRHTGMAFDMWMLNIQIGDPDAIMVLVVLAVRRAGGRLNWEDLDDSLNFAAVKRSLSVSEVADEVAGVRAAEADLEQARAELAAADEVEPVSNGTKRKTAAKITRA